MSPAHVDPTNSEAGFTLLEILAVLVIVALTVAAVHVSGGRQTKGAALKATAVRFASHLRDARTEAIRSGRDRVVLVDLGARSVAAGAGQPLLDIPTFVRAQIQTAASERRSSTIAGIRFYSNGRSSGGHMTMAYGDLRYDVQTNWLTGRSIVLGQK